MNFLRVAYTRLDTDSPFCHLCMTAMHEAKHFASIKKARAMQSFSALPTKFYLQEGSNCCFEEAQSYVYNHAMSHVAK